MIDGIYRVMTIQKRRERHACETKKLSPINPIARWRIWFEVPLYLVFKPGVKSIPVSRLIVIKLVLMTKVGTKIENALQFIVIFATGTIIKPV